MVRNFKIQTGSQHRRVSFHIPIPLPSFTDAPHSHTKKYHAASMTCGPHRCLFIFRSLLSVSHHPRRQVKFAVTEGAGTAGPAASSHPRLPAAGYASVAPAFETKRPLTSVCLPPGLRPSHQRGRQDTNQTAVRSFVTASRAGRGRLSSRAAYKIRLSSPLLSSPHLGGVFTNAGPLHARLRTRSVRERGSLDPKASRAGS